MSQDIEPSLSEYARFYGLTIDHLESGPLAALSLSHGLFDQFRDEDTLFNIDSMPEPIVNLDEKLLAGQDAALLLASITEVSRQNQSFSEITQLSPHRVRDMKIETPMLVTDHESDMRAFREPMVPDLANEHLPLESLDEESDEGPTWPSACQELPDRYIQIAREERLELSIDALRYLQLSSWRGIPLETQLSFEGDSPSCVRVRKAPKLNEWPTDLLPQPKTIDPAMTPLMPMSPIATPYEPSSDTGRLEFQSEQSSPSDRELRVFDRTLFEENRIAKHEDDLVAVAQKANGVLLESEKIGDIYSPLRNIEEPPSSPPLWKPSRQDAKAEVPLTPPPSTQPPPWKRKYSSFSEAIVEVIPELPPPIPEPEKSSSEDLDRVFAETIAPVAVKAERSIEQEQLQEADTMHRVEVPIMDFSLPVAPWKASTSAAESANSHKEKLSDMKTNYLSRHKWPENGATELALKWMPFPAALGRVETYETIPDEGIMKEFLTQLECVDSATLIWKRDGLRIFDDLEDSDEEQLGSATLPDDDNIVSLLRKRKLELEQVDGGESQGIEDDARYGPLNQPVIHEAFRKIPRLSPRPRPETPRPKQTVHNHGIQAQAVPDSFAGMSSLDNFISLRNKGTMNSKRTAQENSHSKIRAQPLDITMRQSATIVPVNVRQTLDAPRSLAFPTPHIRIPEHASPFVVSTSFLLKRTLLRQIKRLYPLAEIIERDFTLHTASYGQQSSPKSDEAISKSSTIADEADMILSPGTGLILTTVQKIKQRPLPGKIATSTIRERVRRATPRYERLVIIISCDPSEIPAIDFGNTMASRLNDKDGEALADFTAFCMAVDEDCRPIIAAGTEEDLACWVVSVMIRYGINDPKVRLLQEETLWEVFLRRAGMNAFAAQVILSELKLPDIDPSNTRGQLGVKEGFGLSVFVRMSLTERLARFQNLLGGSKVLKTTSRVLDARW